MGGLLCCRLGGKTIGEEDRVLFQIDWFDPPKNNRGLLIIIMGGLVLGLGG